MLVLLGPLRMHPRGIRLLWEPRNLWIGVRWNKKEGDYRRYPLGPKVEYHVCLTMLPCLSIHLWWTRQTHVVIPATTKNGVPGGW